MLRSLSIQNYALINQIEIDFNEGFSIITGETGSGKSILLGALSLIIGQRPDVNVLKDKERKCVIEGTFDIRRYNLEHFFQDNDLDFEEETLLRREILPSGKSRAFVNDSPVSIRLLKEIGLRLVDIHSQNQNLALGDSGFQLRIVDTYARHHDLLDKYKIEYRQFCETKDQLAKQTEEAAKAKADLDYFQFQFNQLDEAALKTDEQEELEQELKTLNHSEEIKSNLYKASGILSAEEMSVLPQLKEAEGALSQLQGFTPEVDEMHRRMESVYIELQDLASELEMKSEAIEYDPARIEYLNERLDLIYSLQQKHRVESVAALLQIQCDLEEKIQQITSSDDVIEQLEKQLKQQTVVLEDVADRLSASRADVIPDIENTIVEQLVQLGMPNVSFKVEQQRLEEFHGEGKDRMIFLFSANKNGRLEEISKVASGGEMSRLMLSIKYLISASTALPSIVFDEIDTGVSGEIADKMGLMMQRMSDNIQVISITHLPQIASKGQFHYKVYKADDELETYSNIIRLSSEERVEELAKMLSGSDLTEAAVENARALLNN
ncbi:MAG: DNA repair protein RecN [Marinifilaceae bacterium]